MTRPQRIALFGGSFDPVHTDHLNIAKACHEDLGFDEVWFIPTYLNPFKVKQNSSVQDRLAMLDLMREPYDWIKVYDYEIHQAKPSYTYKTVKHILDNPEFKNMDFAFIMGSDQLDDFETWNNFEDLIKLIKFKVFLRQDDYNKQVVEKYGLEVFNFNRLGLSSTMIRNLENLDLEIPRVNDYINYKLLYLNDRVAKQMDEKRFIHSLNVGLMARDLALKNHLNPEKALIAGTLHDITKRWSEQKALEYLEAWLPQLVEEPKPVWHSFTAYLHLEHDWLIHDAEILNAVFNHTVGEPGMSQMDKVVFCADKISEERDYAGVEELRQTCFEDLDHGFKQLVQNQYDVAVKKHGVDHIGAKLQKTYDYYVVQGKN